LAISVLSISRGALIFWTFFGAGLGLGLGAGGGGGGGSGFGSTLGISVNPTSMRCMGIDGSVLAIKSEAVGISAAWINAERAKEENIEPFITWSPWV
jgi:hypothetical protein